MTLTQTQKTAIKTHIAGNSSTIPAGRPFAGTAVSALPNTPDANHEIALWYSAQESPDYHVLRTNVTPAEIFDQVTWANYTPADAPDNTVTWSNRSLACQGKQFNLQIMLQGQATFNASRVNMRSGLNDATTNLLSGTSGAIRSGGWAGILTILRRAANRIEKLLSAQGTGVGINGADALGATTNPAIMGYEGTISGDAVEDARLNG